MSAAADVLLFHSRKTGRLNMGGAGCDAVMGNRYLVSRSFRALTLVDPDR